MKTKEYREKIAEAFLKSLQEDPVCWKQQWKSLSYIPRNLVTEKPYRGINCGFPTCSRKVVSKIIAGVPFASFRTRDGI